MSISRSLVFGLSLGLLSTAGCASAPSVYGQRARFSPAFHGYVMAPNDGSDDPGTEETHLLLRDPLTGKKLRCREDVEEWREIYEDVALDELHDHRAAVAASVTTGVVFGPAAALQPIGSLITLEALYATGSLYKPPPHEEPLRARVGGHHPL